MRTLYDSTTAADIPADAQMVAGYIDGLYAWSEADWALFPRAVKVRIAVSAATDAGQVLDVEPGDATPQEAVRWVQTRRLAGADPSVYCDASTWSSVRTAFALAGIPEPHYWIAEWDNDPTLLAGAVAKQYADPSLSGGHFDVSIVADRWPGVDDMTPDDVKALIAQYGQTLETSELLPMKQDIAALLAHVHDAGLKTSPPKQP